MSSIGGSPTTVCFDARRLGAHGVGRHARSILNHLVPLAHHLHFHVICKPEGIAWLQDVSGADNVTLHLDPTEILSFEECLAIGRLLSESPGDLVHLPTQLIPPFFEAPFVVTIHDLMHLQYPSFLPSADQLREAYGSEAIRDMRKVLDTMGRDYGPASHEPRATSTAGGEFGGEEVPISAYVGSLLPILATKATLVLAVSAFVKKCLQEQFGVDPTKVLVVHNSADEIFQMVTNRAQVAHQLRLLGAPARYFLFVGRWRPHKNLGLLLKSYTALRSSGKEIPRLVLVTRPDRDLGVENALLAQLRDDGHAIVFEGCDDAHLSVLYNGALALVAPSVIEGFDLPVVEAMACGTPVLLSSIPAHKEVAGRAGIFFSPHDSKTLTRLLLEASEAEKEELMSSDVLIGRARLFSWERSAQLTLGAYQIAMRLSEGRS